MASNANGWRDSDIFNKGVFDTRYEDRTHSIGLRGETEAERQQRTMGKVTGVDDFDDKEA